MEKTTIYLPNDLKLAVKRLAAESSRSEAEVIRDAIAKLAAQSRRPRPLGGIFASGDSTLSEDVDEALAGFGQG